MLDRHRPLYWLFGALMLFFAGTVVANALTDPPPLNGPEMPAPPESQEGGASDATSQPPAQTSAPAKASAPAPSKIEFVPLAFEVSGLAIFQSLGSSYSPEIGWVPRYQFTDHLAIKLAFDGAVLKGVGGNLTSIDYQAMLSWGPEAVKLNLGGGGQTWIGQGTSPIATGQFEISFGDRRFLALFDRIILSYSFYPIPNRVTNEVEIGGGFAF